MKKSFFLVITFLLLFTTSVYANNESNMISTNEIEIEGIYDEELGDLVIGVYTLDENGNFIEIALSDYQQLDQVNELSNLTSPHYVKAYDDTKLSNQLITPFAYNYYYYKFEESSTSTSVGSAYKISADYQCTYNTDGCPMSISDSATVNSTFSANVNTQVKKDAVTAGISFTYSSSLSSSTSVTFTDKLPYGKKGYIAFKPYYNVSSGKLKYMQHLGAYHYERSYVNASVTVPKSINVSGQSKADGLYLVMLVN